MIHFDHSLMAKILIITIAVITATMMEITMAIQITIMVGTLSIVNIIVDQLDDWYYINKCSIQIKSSGLFTFHLLF